MWVTYKPIEYRCYVYDISYDKNGYPLFLVYINERWQRLSAKHFIP